MKMRSKLVLLLSAALIGSTALVASAQNPNRPRAESPGADMFTPGQEPATVDVFGPTTVIRSAPADRNGAVVSHPAPGAYTFYAANSFEAHGQEGALARKAEALARRLAEAKTNGEIEPIKVELHKVLQEQFALRQKRHEDEIEKLEAQVKKLRDLVNKRQEHRDQIIENRIKEMLGEAMGLGW